MCAWYGTLNGIALLRAPLFFTPRLQFPCKIDLRLSARSDPTDLKSVQRSSDPPGSGDEPGLPPEVLKLLRSEASFVGCLQAGLKRRKTHRPQTGESNRRFAYPYLLGLCSCVESSGLHDLLSVAPPQLRVADLRVRFRHGEQLLTVRVYDVCYGAMRLHLGKWTTAFERRRMWLRLRVLGSRFWGRWRGILGF